MQVMNGNAQCSADKRQTPLSIQKCKISTYYFLGLSDLHRDTVLIPLSATFALVNYFF